MIQYRASINENVGGGFTITYEFYHEQFREWQDLRPVKPAGNRYGMNSKQEIKPGTFTRKNAYGRHFLKNNAPFHWWAKSLAKRQIAKWEWEDKKRARNLKSTVIEGNKLDI